jgi:hypothetical protein
LSHKSDWDGDAVGKQPLCVQTTKTNGGVEMKFHAF